jgi:integrase
MPLEIQRGRSKWFYGRLELDGKPVFKNLNVRIEGKVPRSLKEEGDGAFERSRARAQVALDKLKAGLRDRSNSEELLQKILEIRTGSRMRSIPLDEMAIRWKALPRRRTLATRHAAQAVADIGRFTSFVARRYPAVTEMAAVTDSMAHDYISEVESRQLSPKRYNDILKLLRSCFGRLRKEAGIASNPFDDIPTKEPETIHRKPFTAEELTAILNAAKEAPDIYPLLVLAACTAMRLGDCARIDWKHIDLDGGFVDVKASKTKQLVTIPIFPLLRSVLDAQPKRKEGYVFPSLATQYQVAPDHLTDMARRVMEAVGFGDPDEKSAGGGATRGAFHQAREHGVRRASIRDIQSFRVTWVTLALNAGVPIDLVRKVTGHRTVDVVLTSYHQPGREDYRRELSSKLPLALTGGPATGPLPLGTIKQRLLAMTAENWSALRDELLTDLAKRVTGWAP